MQYNWQSPNNDVVIYAKSNPLIDRAYISPMAQGQRLRNSQSMVPTLPGEQMIMSPDAQSQTDIGYTQPIQDFTGGAAMSGVYYSKPGGAINGKRLSQPTLKVAAPQQPIPTGMPWNY